MEVRNVPFSSWLLIYHCRGNLQDPDSSPPLQISASARAQRNGSDTSVFFLYSRLRWRTRCTHPVPGLYFCMAARPVLRKLLQATSVLSRRYSERPTSLNCAR